MNKPDRSSKAHAGGHVSGNGMPFTVSWQSSQVARGINVERSTLAYGAAGRSYVGWHLVDADGDTSGPYASSRQAWAKAMGKPDDWHNRPTRRKA